MTTTKPFDVSKRLVWEAYKRVKANAGAAGVDGQSLEEFERSLSNNLYRIWNRMASGSYFPPPVKAVSIPKRAGGQRTLGIPTVADRIAQTAVKLALEPELEPHFHADSYGYRPGKSAHQALAVTRKRCWWHAWVLEFDICGLFDNIDHGLLMKALRHHTKCRWVLLYTERWLTAPMQREDGSIEGRNRGTPQGGPLSPLLANLFLHYAFDRWMATHHGNVPFCRYADDGIIHCRTESQARNLQRQLAWRLRECGLELHPDKTRVVYCKDQHRTLTYKLVQFDFLGFNFRPRRSNDRYGQVFTNFTPALSGTAAKSMRQTIRSWKLQLMSDKSIDYLAYWFGPRIQGWMEYYCRFYRSAFWCVAHHLNRALVRWAMRKYKRFRGHKTRAWQWLAAQAKRRPGLFPHWRAGFVPYAGPMGAR